jgi:hypothetical protein
MVRFCKANKSLVSEKWRLEPSPEWKILANLSDLIMGNVYSCSSIRCGVAEVRASNLQELLGFVLV